MHKFLFKTFLQYCIVEFMRFLKHEASLGSAAMSLKCVGMCYDHFVANFVLSLAVK